MGIIVITDDNPYIDLHNYDKFENISNIDEFSMDDEWYEIAIESHFWFEWRFNAMQKQLAELKIPINKELKVLEVGCGTGVLREAIESNTNWNVDAADLNINALSHVKPGRGRTMLYDIYDESKSLIASYDVVILYDVLEHIKNTRPFIESLIKHLKPNGYLLINVPALNTLFSVYDTKMGHFRRYNKKTLIDEFHHLKLKVLDIRYWGLSMLPLLALRSIIMYFFNKDDENEIVKRGFKPPNNIINWILKLIMRLETMIVSKPPLGTSLLMIGKS